MRLASAEILVKSIDVCDAAATGVVTTTDTLVAYIKQIITHVLAEADVEAKVDVIDEHLCCRNVDR